MHKIITAGAAALLLGSLTACDTTSLSQESKNDTPTVVQAGKPFTHDNFKVAPGWTLAKEGFTGDAVIKGLKVTNTGGDKRTALLTFRLYKGKNVLAEISCDSKEMQKGETSKLDCLSTDKLPKGNYVIKIADMF